MSTLPIYQQVLPVDIEALRPAALEAESRPVRHRKLEVLDYTPTDSNAETWLTQPGTITVFLARQGSQTLAEIREAAKTGDGRGQEIIERIHEQLDSRPALSLPEAVEVLRSQPVFAEIRYGGRTLASNLFTPDDLDACVVALPYNGGRLSQAGFTLVEYYVEETDLALDALLLRHSPPLSDAEAAALEKVPSIQWEQNVGRAYACYAITAVTVVAVVIAATYACPGTAPRSPDDEHIAEAEIRKLGPAATARQLLAIRRRLLTGQ